MDSVGKVSPYHYEGGIGVGTLDRRPIGINLSHRSRIPEG